MTKSKKILVWILVLGGMLLLVAVIAVNFLLSPERIKQALVPVLESALERKVSVERIDVGLFRGITAEKFEIRDPANDELLLAARKAVLKYQLWPLLKKQVVIDQVQLDAPELTLVRQQDGRFNTFSTTADAPPSAEEAVTAQSEPTAASGLDLLVSEISISNGTLLFVDKKLNPQAPFRYQVKNLLLKANHVALDREFPLEISGELDNSGFQLKGNIDLALPGGSFKINVEQLALESFAPYFRDALPGIFSRAGLTVALDVAVSADQVAVNGDLNLGEIYLVLDAAKDLPIRDGELAFKLDLQADLANSRVLFHPSRARYNQIELQLEGELQDWENTARFEMDIAVDKLKLRDAIASLPVELTSHSNGLDPAGTISLQAKLQGDVNQQPLSWIRQATLDLDELQGNIGELRPSLSGPVTLTEQNLSAAGLRLAAGDNQANVDFSIANILSSPLKLHTAVQADSIDLDLLGSTGQRSPGAPGDTPAGTDSATPEDEVGPFDWPLDGEGSAQIKQLKMHGITSEDVELHYYLKNNILTIDRLAAKLGGGSFSQTARIDLAKKGLAYQSELKFESVQAAQLLAAFAPQLQGVVSGSLDLTSTLKGYGTKWEKLSKNLDASGQAQMSGLQLTNAPVVSELAGFLQLNELKQIVFDEAKSSFKISQGMIDLDSQLNGKQIRLAPQGKVGLDGTLNLSVPTLLAPEVSSRLGSGQLAGLFVNSQGWTELPIKLKGSVSAPEFKVDSKQVRNKAINKIEEKLLQKLAPKQAGEKPVDPKKQLLEDTLKGLLGR